MLQVLHNGKQRYWWDPTLKWQAPRGGFGAVEPMSTVLKGALLAVGFVGATIGIIYLARRYG